jgi:hypothetical protein
MRCGRSEGASAPLPRHPELAKDLGGDDRTNRRSSPAARCTNLTLRILRSFGSSEAVKKSRAATAVVEEALSQPPKAAKDL